MEFNLNDTCREREKDEEKERKKERDDVTILSTDDTKIVIECNFN